MKNVDLEKLLLEKEPEGPFRCDYILWGVRLGPIENETVSGYDWPNDQSSIQQLNRAFSIGRWLGRAESEPPLAKDSDYKPICKLCGQMVDDMVMSNGEKMCVDCFAHKVIRNLITTHQIFTK